MKKRGGFLLIILFFSFTFVPLINASMAEDMESALAASGGDPSKMISGMVKDQLEAAEKNKPCESQKAKVDQLMEDLDSAKGDEYKYECIRSCIGFAKGLVTKEAIFSWITMNSIQHELGGEYCPEYGYGLDSCNVCDYDVEMPSEEDMEIAGMTGPMIEFWKNAPEMAAQSMKEVEAGWKKQIKDSQKDPLDDYEDKAFEGLSLKEKFNKAFGGEYDDSTMSSKFLSLFSDNSPSALDNSRQLTADTIEIVGKMSGLGYFVLQPFSDIISPTTSTQEKIIAGVDLAFMFAPAVSEAVKSIKGLDWFNDAAKVAEIPGVTLYKNGLELPGMPNKYLKLEEGAISINLYKKQVLSSGNFNNLLNFGDEYLQLHVSAEKGAMGKLSTAKDLINGFDKLNELGLKYPIVGDTPNAVLIKKATESGAVIIESPSYQKIVTGGGYWLESKFGIVPEAEGPVQRIIFLKK